jgi:hypothetical protein
MGWVEKINRQPYIVYLQKLTATVKAQGLPRATDSEWDLQGILRTSSGARRDTKTNGEGRGFFPFRLRMCMVFQPLYLENFLAQRNSITSFHEMLFFFPFLIPFHPCLTNTSTTSDTK